MWLRTHRVAAICFLGLLTSPLVAPAGVVVSAELAAGDAGAGDLFGAAAAIDGDLAVVGAPGKGAAYVYRRSGSVWSEEAQLTPSAATPGARFGSAVAIDGETILVGAPRDASDVTHGGAAFVFVRTSTAWIEQQRLAPTDLIAWDSFGESVSLHRDTALVGAPHNVVGSPTPGAAYVFDRAGPVWSLTQKLGPAASSNGAVFGGAVAIDGDTVAVGAVFDDEAGTSAGAAHLFVRSTAGWTEEAKLLGEATGDLFGGAVAVDGQTALVGAVQANVSGLHDAGAAYVFVRSGFSWSLQQKLVASDPGEDDRFGISVDLDGDAAAIARLTYPSPSMIGLADDVHAYLFLRDEDDWSEQEKVTTGQPMNLVDSDGELVGLSGCTLLVGTARQDQPAGIDAGGAHAYLLDSCPCEIPPGEMVGWWPLDELAPDVSLDVAGDHDGLWVNMPSPMPGIVDGALFFDGHGRYVEIADAPELNFGANRSFTIDLWLNPILHPKAAALVDKRDDAGRGYGLWLKGGHPMVLLGDGTGTSVAYVSAAPLPLDAWSFLAVTVDRDADHGEVWVNGALDGTFTPSATAPGSLSNAGPLRIAANSVRGDYYFGLIDEVELFRRALGPLELATLAGALSGGKCKPCTEPPPGMAAWWTLDETGGPVSADIIGGNDASWEGAPFPSLGKVKTALAFNGIDQHLKVGDHPSLDFGAGESFSIDAWVRPEALVNVGTLVAKEDGKSGVGYKLFMRNNQPVFLMQSTGGLASYVSPTQLPAGAWSLVAVTVDRASGTGTLYINGAADGTFSLGTVGSVANDWPLVLANDFTDGYRLYGRLDEVEIFRRALTATEVNRLWIADGEGKCRPEETPARGRYLRLSLTASNRPYGNLCELEVRTENGWTRPARARASDEYSAAYAAPNAADGDLRTHWFGSARAPFPKWILFDLGAPVGIEALRFYLWPSDAPQTLDLHLSTDGRTYTPVETGVTVPYGGAWYEHGLP